MFKLQICVYFSLTSFIDKAQAKWGTTGAVAISDNTPGSTICRQGREGHWGSPLQFENPISSKSSVNYKCSQMITIA